MRVVTVALLALLVAGPVRAADCSQAYPDPEVVVSRANYDPGPGGGHRPYTFFYFEVLNQEQYPDSLFAWSSSPPWPSSRTWVNVFSADGRYLMGFRYPNRASSLSTTWFRWAGTATAPPRVFMELWDRECGRTYRSNRAPVVFSRYLPLRASEAGWTWQQARDHCEEIGVGVHLATLDEPRGG